MPPQAINAQEEDAAKESRTEKVGIAVTPSEKRAVKVIAGIHGTDESNLCRARPIAEIVAEFDRIRSTAAAHEAQ